MKSKIRRRDSESLAYYKSAFENTESTPQITEGLASIGYNSEKLDLGKQLLKETRLAFQACTSNKGKLRNLNSEFQKKKDELDAMFDLDRKKAKLLYRNDTGKADRLFISGQLPRVYPTWIETVRQFYVEITADQSIQEELTEVNLSMEEINAGLAKIEEVEEAFTAHLKARGAAQSSTKLKDASFNRMHDWMSAFYTAARIGLKGDLQKLESLGKIVKS